MATRGTALALWRWAKPRLALLVLLGAVLVLSALNHRSGHDWGGDDFALYIHQSQALVEGNVGEVLAMNRYTSLESSWPYGPYAVPWGTPILLAPVVAFFGVDYPMLKLWETLFFVGFLFVFYELVVRRAGRIVGLVLVAFIGLNFRYVIATDQVLSEFPYLLFAAISLWWLDRCRETGAWRHGPLRPLVICGVLIGFTFAVRREGIVLVLALVAAQIVQMWKERSALPWRRLATPYAAAASFVVGMQLVIPGVILRGRYDTGFHNFGDNVGSIADAIAAHLGLMDLGAQSWEFLGSDVAARTLFALFVVLALVGMGFRLLEHFETDAPLVTFMVGSLLMIGLLRTIENRYLFAITPFMAYFAFQGIIHIGRLFTGGAGTGRVRLVPMVAAASLFAVFLIANATDLQQSTWFSMRYGDISQGPEAPLSREMLDTVEEHTRRDEVIGFFKPRVVNLYTGRQSVALLTVRHVLERTDWYVMVKGTEYAQVLLAPEEAAAVDLELYWENDRFVLWRVPDR